MKNYICVVVLFLGNYAFGYNDLPYPPQNNPPYPVQNNLPYPVVDSMPQPSTAMYPLTQCNIPPGTYRVDLINSLSTSDFFTNEAKLYIQVNNGGLLTILFKYTEFIGKQELYIITPYRNSFDLSNVCSGTQFNLSFDNIKFYDKRLKGNLKGNFIQDSQTKYLNVNGKIKRLDMKTKAKSEVKLADTKLKFIYSY
ncbi:hypothetical protein [Endozoicomonas euniceicola]|uniref:Uncharacterized protein n=1 Tax=Endozoicomonas euniceicola TaxID=1234143 RepID=A0ABY6GWF1_9GAMM|nr:hypothetical protein [Endozoicomonas euniceicola]UYM16378.1 hypothetical protein NX720_00105 [Endozoicomonas euniceicola]